MSQFPFAIVGFDLDGTVFDTSGDLAAAVNHALQSIDRPPLDIATIRTMIGGGARHMLAQGLTATGGYTEGELDRLERVLLDHYAANIAVHTRPFAGAIAALDDLAARGVKLALVTNKLEHLTLKLLDALELRDRFACVLGGDSLGPGKAKPAPDLIHAMIERCGGGRAAFVGDSIYDVTAAHAARIPVIACSFGFRTEPVETLGADAVIDHFDELVAALERIAGASAAP